MLTTLTGKFFSLILLASTLSANCPLGHNNLIKTATPFLLTNRFGCFINVTSSSYMCSKCGFWLADGTSNSWYLHTTNSDYISNLISPKIFNVVKKIKIDDCFVLFSGDKLGRCILKHLFFTTNELVYLALNDFEERLNLEDFRYSHGEGSDESWGDVFRWRDKSLKGGLNFLVERNKEFEGKSYIGVIDWMPFATY